MNDASFPMTPEDVLGFWFGELNSLGCSSDTRAAKWWHKDPAYDRNIVRTFGGLHDSIREGGKGEWMESARGRLATIIVLDQFSRNMFRGSPQMYATDTHALALALEGIQLEEHKQLAVDERTFFYMPLMHSEDLAYQDRCIELLQELREESPVKLFDRLSKNIDSARRHREIVARFGRFPHRNTMMQRRSTPEEIEFLGGPNSSF